MSTEGGQLQDPLFEMLVRQLGAKEFVVPILERTQKSVAFFRSLRQIGLEEGTPVHLFEYAEVPHYGLVIADHLTETARMRVNMYTVLRTERLHPFVEVRKSDDEGLTAYRVFSEYYEGIRSRAVPIS